MDRFNVVISGSREYDNFWEFVYALDEILKFRLLGQYYQILEGGARGVDKLARQYAILRKMPHLLFPADWDKHGKAAGHIRNVEMLREGDFLIAFWDGQSKGTYHAIHTALKKRMRTIIVRVDLDMRVIEVPPNGEYKTCREIERPLRKLPLTSLQRFIQTNGIESCWSNDLAA